MISGKGPLVLRPATRASRPHCNAGMFAMTADALHWALWRDAFRRAYEGTGRIIPDD